MNRKEITKNLKHGYIFLGSFILLFFLIGLGIEIYLTGGLSTQSIEPKEEVIEVETSSDSEFILEIENLESPFKTHESEITIVGKTEENAVILLNSEAIELGDQYRFEKKFDLIIGTNYISIQGFLNDELKKEITLEVIREEKVEKKKQEETPKEEPQKQNPQPAPTPQPVPNPQPSPPPPVTQQPPPPKPNPVQGLKLSCSINNTHPSIGGTVSINCAIKDQNNNSVLGAFGYVTVNWQSGSSIYTLSQSNGNGDMSVSFTVPAGNTGTISGNVQASKDGLNVNSNFNLNVQ